LEISILLTFLQIWYQLVDNVLHGSIKADILQGVGLMDDISTSWTSIIFLQMLHQTALTNLKEK
jgi:hypothetical protein